MKNCRLSSTEIEKNMNKKKQKAFATKVSKFSWSDNNILLLLEAANTFKSIWEYKSVR